MRQKTDAKNRCLELAHLKEELKRAQKFLMELQSQSACLYDDICHSIREGDTSYLEVDLPFADHHDFSIISPIICSGKLSLWDEDPLLCAMDEGDPFSGHWTSDSSLDEDLFSSSGNYGNCGTESMGNR